ncbi:MAG: hypothetical protein OEQ13_00810 [Acidobacteriota bacterium]|nr:hypothetical protein [Acidobacteriota bacterium]
MTGSRIKLCAAVVLSMTIAPLIAAADTIDATKSELERVKSLYRAITSYHVLLHGEGASEATVSSALYDIERYVDELDGRLATDELFISDQAALEEISDVVARAHFQAALLHAKGVDLERSIVHYERVVDLLGYDPVNWDVSLERSGRMGLSPEAKELVFEMAAPRRVVDDLKTFWSAGVVTRFKVEEYTHGQRARFSFARVGGRQDAFSEAAFRIAKERFAQRLAAGLEEFRVVLPAGTYEIGGEDETFVPRQFAIVKGGVPDPMVLNPNSFSFELAGGESTCRPRLSLNGVEIRDFSNLPFGTYRVTPSPDCTRRLPDRITVEQKSEVTLRTEPERLDLVREGQPIFLFITTPAGSTYSLRM